MLSDEVMIAFIGMVGSVLTVGMSLWTQAIVRKQGQSIQETKNTIQTLEKNTNSIKDALVSVTAKAAYAKGVKHATATSKSSDDLLTAASAAATVATAAATAAATVAAAAAQAAALVGQTAPAASPAPPPPLSQPEVSVMEGILQQTQETPIKVKLVE